MKKQMYVLYSIGILASLFSCRQAEKEEKYDDSRKDKHYVSMDGLWKVTPETAIRYPHGTIEPVIQISGDVLEKPAMRGCFLWEGRFYDYWDIKVVQINDSLHQLLMKFDENGIYKGTIDQKKERIQGIAYWDITDTSDWNKIDFIRCAETDVAKWFIPYPANPDGSIHYIYHIPPESSPPLQRASIFQFVKDTTAFYHLMERIIRQDFGRLESLIIIKDQKLLLEEYFFGYDRKQLHYINSCTKSVVSLLLGIALERHNALNVEVPAFGFFPQSDTVRNPEKKKITLKHLLTMTSGLPVDDDFECFDPIDVVKEMLDQPLETHPGESFAYNNNSTNLLGSMIYTLEKKQADAFAKEVLFNKLGISEYTWDKENNVVQCHNGLHMLPTDMAKIGLLALNNGYWNGEEIVPAEWIAMSTKPTVAESEYFDYGFQWWCRSRQNKSWWKDPVQGSRKEHDMFLALGFGGQYIMVIRDLNIVVAITSSDNCESNGRAHQKVPLVIEEIVPLFR